MWRIAVSMLGIAAVAGIAAWVSNRSMKKEETVSDYKIYCDVFTLQQAKKWVKEKLVNKDCKVMISKSTHPDIKDLMEKYHLITDDIEDCLLLVCMDASANQMKDFLVVEYGTLEAELEELLGSEGMVVINGG